MPRVFLAPTDTQHGSFLDLFSSRDTTPPRCERRETHTTHPRSVAVRWKICLTRLPPPPTVSCLSTHGVRNACKRCWGFRSPGTPCRDGDACHQVLPARTPHAKQGTPVITESPNSVGAHAENTTSAESGDTRVRVKLFHSPATGRCETMRPKWLTRQRQFTFFG